MIAENIISKQDFYKTVGSLAHAVVEHFKTAVELGKWPDGRFLTIEQKQLCLESILAYEYWHQVPIRQRLGYVARRCQKNNINQ